jgi:phytoene dehydrogenase-like protein
MTDALENLVTELGVEIRCGTTVTAIANHGVYVQQDKVDHVGMTDKNNNNDDDDDNQSSRSRTSATTSEFLPADLIIVNADLPYAKASLMDIHAENNNNTLMDQKVLPTPAERFDWDDTFSFSSGVISFHWSVDKELEDLLTHNVFLVAGSRSEAEASWHVLRQEQQNDDDKNDIAGDKDGYDDTPFNFYVHRPSKTDPSAAPQGCDSIMVLVPCRTLLRDDDCSALPRNEAIQKYKEQFSETVVTDVRKAVLRRMAAVGSLHDLEHRIVHEVVDTPATWADQFNLAAGTPFGLVRMMLLHIMIILANFVWRHDVYVELSNLYLHLKHGMI